FEEHRFWDIRRWKDAQNLPAQLTELILDNSTGSIVINQKEVAPFKFELKNYYMPVPFSEIQKNSKLIQNEGYY
ncbi:RagB/SusD family nutrient uptake outer membrane protein, partial [Acinetobacter baumannii]